MSNKRIAIAIDGPAASGKSSTARAIARALDFRHVDSGALYRAATAARARLGGEPASWSEESVLDAARTVSLSPTGTGFTPLLDGLIAESEMRSEEVTGSVSIVAKMSRVRDWVNAQVRQAGEQYDVVVDGRDIGTVVFPDAQLKVFMSAAPAERARRRLIEKLGRDPAEGEIAEEAERLSVRDAMDAAQSVRAPDAIVIDTTRLTFDEQVAEVVRLFHESRAGGAAT